MPEERFVLAGRQGLTWGNPPLASGCYSEMPWTPNGRRSVPFPVTLECLNRFQAWQAHEVLQILAEAWVLKPDLTALLDGLSRNPKLIQLALAMDHTSGYFLVVLLGRIRGIYLSRRQASKSLAGSSSKVFRDVAIYTSFLDALKGLFTFGDHKGGLLFRGHELPKNLPPGHRMVESRGNEAVMELPSFISSEHGIVGFKRHSTVRASASCHDTQGASESVIAEAYQQSPGLVYAVNVQ
ncbi:hypothetical protein C8J56DRAFT_1053030 [Mycena floridula]|nr:hypothetical protein C8J56DRAFT_1053030 [Mycena floridula]